MEGNALPKLSSQELTDVRLIVKSANQQFDDVIIHSEPTWTIRRLKAHLTQVYPSNPTVPEQKLIYSGQLLSDELILKDILRSYKDVETENHIFHLVYTPKISATKPKPAVSPPLEQKTQSQKLEKPPVIASSSVDGLRHRNVTSTSSNATVHPSVQTAASTTHIQQQIPNIAYPFAVPQVSGAAGCPTNYSNATPFSFPNQFSNGIVSEQEAAVQNWVQQVYSNYMDQCLRMANATLNAGQMQPNAPSIPMFMPFPQFMQPAAQAAPFTATRSVPHTTVDGPSTSGASRASFAPRVVPVIPTVTHAQPAAVPTAGREVPPAPAPAPEPAPAPADNIDQPQPRFPNIVQEEQDNRDWLDSFYSITRLVALLTLVYFYSSPLRCLVVAIIAIGIYLYHIGFFQTRRQAQVNNRNLNNNQNINDNNAQGAAAEVAHVQNPAQVAAAEPGVGDTASEPLISSTTPPESETSTTSLIAFVRTFVVSFFASLLPETPAL